MRSVALLTRRWILPLLLVVCVFTTAIVQAADGFDKRSEAFVAKLSKDAITLLTDSKVSEKERENRFEKLLTANFDTSKIGKFVLGQYWKTATKQQQREYTKLFKEFLVTTYTKRFENYSGEGLKVVGSRVQGEQYVFVQTLIHNPEDNAMIKVDWRVMGPRDLKIVDVIIEGVSMSLSQRSEFAAVIQRAGGDVDALIALLREKVNGTSAS